MDTQFLNTIQFKEQLPNSSDYWILFNTTDWNNEYKFTPADLKKAIGNSWHALSAFDSDKLIGFGESDS